VAGRTVQAWPRTLGPRPVERTGPRLVNHKRDPSVVDPVGTEVLEEWRGYFLDKGEGYAVYRGPRPRAPERVEVGRAVFGEATPLEEWKSYQSRLDALYKQD